MSSNSNATYNSSSSIGKENINISENNDKIREPSFDSAKLGTTNPDTTEKIVNLIESPKVQLIRESGKDYIDIDIEHLQEGKFYYVEYHGDTYGIEKLSDGQIAVYELIE